MNGYQITFFTHRDRRHNGRPLAEWLVHLAREMDLHGATLIPAAEGFGHRRHLHGAHLFEAGDPPQEVQMAVTLDEAERLFERLRDEDVNLFYVKMPVEFGKLEPDAGGSRP
jgi:PII-like signaling protein